MLEKSLKAELQDRALNKRMDFYKIIVEINYLMLNKKLLF